LHRYLKLVLVLVLQVLEEPGELQAQVLLLLVQPHHH